MRIVFQLFCFKACGLPFAFSELSSEPELIQPLFDLRAKSISLAFFSLKGTIELHKSVHTKLLKNHALLWCKPKT